MFAGILYRRFSLSPYTQALLEMDEGFFLPLKIHNFGGSFGGCYVIAALLTHVRGKQTPTVRSTIILFLKYFCKLYWKDFGVGRGVHFGEQLNWKKTTFVSM